MVIGWVKGTGVGVGSNCYCQSYSKEGKGRSRAERWRRVETAPEGARHSGWKAVERGGGQGGFTGQWQGLEKG